MAYISNVEKFSFNDETLRGFVIEKLDDEQFEISDIEVKFQKNRAIVFSVIIKEHKNCFDKNSLKTIEGRFYKYRFFATVNKTEYIGSNYPFKRYRIIIDLIEFSKQNRFFLNHQKNSI